MMMWLKKEEAVVVGENKAENFGRRALWAIFVVAPRFVFGTVVLGILEALLGAILTVLNWIPTRVKAGATALLVVSSSVWWFVHHKDTVYRAEIAKLCPEYVIETTAPWGVRLIELRAQSILAYAGKGCKVTLSVEDRERLASTERKLTSMAVELAGMRTPEQLQARFKEQGIELSGYAGSHTASMEMALMQLMVVVEGMGFDPFMLDRAEKRAQEAKAQEAEAPKVAAATAKPQVKPVEVTASAPKPPDAKKKPESKPIAVATAKTKAPRSLPAVQKKPGKSSSRTETAAAKKGSDNIDQEAIDKGRAALAAMKSRTSAKSAAPITPTRTSVTPGPVAKR